MWWNSVKSVYCAQYMGKVFLTIKLFILIGQSWITFLFAQNMTPEMVAQYGFVREKKKLFNWPNSTIFPFIFFSKIYWSNYLHGFFVYNRENNTKKYSIFSCRYANNERRQQSWLFCKRRSNSHIFRSISISMTRHRLA